jgi:hypothetical protein
VNGVAFDAGGLIALDGRHHRVLTLIARANEVGARITIPTTALAQAIRNPARQVLISRLIRQVGTDLVPLDGPDATAIGLLLARAAAADIVDAHVVVCAQRAGQAVITSDPDDLARLAPGLRVFVFNIEPVNPWRYCLTRFLRRAKPVRPLRFRFLFALHFALHV